MHAEGMCIFAQPRTHPGWTNGRFKSTVHRVLPPAAGAVEGF